ncbi:interleukin-6, partial [Tachysurus ichikawai]
LALFLFPLLSLGLYSGDMDFYETSGSELQNEAHAPDQKWVDVAKQLRNEVKNARDEQFNRAIGGTQNTSIYAYKGIKMPILNDSDGCLRSDFNAQKCLRLIYTGLRVYQVNMPHLEQESQFITNVMNIKAGTYRLLHLIKETVKVNDEKVPQVDLSEFTDTAWNQNILAHSILYSFTDFMTEASRAINYMKNKKLMRHLKEDKWISKHQK